MTGYERRVLRVAGPAGDVDYVEGVVEEGREVGELWKGKGAG